jgi:hypothetical protein
LFGTENKEKEVFDTKYRALTVQRDKLGMQNIRQKIQQLYEEFITDKWIPGILTKFKNAEAIVTERIFSLGVPLPPDPSYSVFKEARETFQTVTVSQLKERLWNIFYDITTDFEELFAKLSSDDEFWKLLTEFHELFTESGSPSLVKPFDAFHPFDTTSLLGKEVKAQFRSRYAASSCLSNFISARITKVGSDGTFDIEQIKNPYDRNGSQQFLEKEGNVGIERIQLLENQPITKEQTIQAYLKTPCINNQYVPRIVRLMDVNHTANKMKEIIKGILHRFSAKLLAKLTPNPEALRQIVTAKDDYWGPLFHSEGKETLKRKFCISRFPELQSRVEQTISVKLNQCKSAFTSWFEDFIRRSFDDSTSDLAVFIPEFFRENGNVYCYLHWKDKTRLEQLPHLMMVKWSEIYQSQFSKLLDSMKVEDSLFDSETCKETRLSLLKELQELNAVKQAVESFTRQVTRSGFVGSSGLLIVDRV